MKDLVFYGSAVALNWSAPEEGKPVKVQLSPFGEFTLHDGGKMNGKVQHCTREAFEALVANWKACGSPEVLVDVDHASASGGSTEAAAWAKNLRVEDDGLCADFELTPRGRELVGSRGIRPADDCDGSGRFDDFMIRRLWLALRRLDAHFCGRRRERHSRRRHRLLSVAHCNENGNRYRDRQYRPANYYYHSPCHHAIHNAAPINIILSNVPLSNISTLHSNHKPRLP